MKIKNLTEGLNAQQQSVPQLPAMFRPKKISVLNNPTDPRHPMTGYAVGANESIRSKDPYDQGWRTGHRPGQDETACPYKSGTAEHAQWMAGYEEARAQPNHYDEGVAEGGQKQLSVQQLATISDEALDNAYHYGRSTPGNTFGWQANLKSAAYAKQMIDRGVTDIEAISDAIHKGWNVTAQAFVKNPQMFDDSKTMAPEKLQAKIAQRQKLMTQNYAELPEDEKEKDRVVARALLQALKVQQGVTEGKGLAKKVKIVKGPDAGKTGWIREIKRGAFKGAAKSYYIDLDDGGQANNIPGTALRLVKDPGVVEGRAGVDDTDTVGFSVNSEAAYTAVMKRFGDIIDHDETSGIMYAPAGVWPRIEMTAFDADPDSGAVRVDDDMMEAERNEMDTLAVQTALKKMAERHRGEKWTKEQLAALGKRIAAHGKKAVKEGDVEDFLARGGKITQVKPNRGPRSPGTSLGSKHIGTLRGGRASSISGKSANTRPTVKPVVAVESITKEDIISKLKARLGDYLSDISKEIKKDPDLVDKLSARAPGDQMGPPVKTVTTDDGHKIQIHGNEDDGFRISIKNRPAKTKFKNLDEAVMACEIYCARQRNKNSDYLDEA
jgi:post-segregation antitoxin (ccd killing protein)